jgi:hypothetical protein
VPTAAAGEGDGLGDVAAEGEAERLADPVGEGEGRDAALLEPQAARVRMATTQATNLKRPSVFWPKGASKS